MDLAARTRVFASVHQLVVSAKLHNPDDLEKVLKAAKRVGIRRQMEEAARRSTLGHEVVLDGKYTPEGSTTSYQADILDITSRESVQLKTLTTTSGAQARSEFTKAVDQLAGTTGEVSPPGCRRVATLQFEIGAFDHIGTAAKAEVQRKLQSLNLRPGRTDAQGNQIVNQMSVSKYAGMTLSSRAATRETFTPGQLEPPPGQPGAPAPNHGPSHRGHRNPSRRRRCSACPGPPR